MKKKCKIFTKSFALLFFRRIFAVPNEGYQIIGVWRSWLAHLVWDQRVLCSSHSTPTKEQLIFNCSFFLFTFDSAWFCPHFSLVSWMAHFQIKVPSIKTALFVDGSMFLTTVSIKTGLFVDGSMFLTTVSIKTALFLDRSAALSTKVGIWWTNVGGYVGLSTKVGIWWTNESRNLYLKVSFVK